MEIIILAVIVIFFLANSGNIIGVINKAKAEEKRALDLVKRGKTKEQKDIIDFLYIDPNGCKWGNVVSSDMTIQGYEQIVAQKLYNLDLRQRAIEKIGLDESEIEEIEPIPLSGYVFDDNNKDIMVKAVDGRAVSSRFSVTWIFFSKTQMYTYTYTFETISDNIWETTRDFFYQDVTCMTMKQRVVEKIDSLQTGCFSNKEACVKNNFLVDTLEIVVPGATYSFSMRNNEDLERSLRAAKAMLRERKYIH